MSMTNNAPASRAILKQAIDDGAFDGEGIASFGQYTVAWDTVRGLVAIADDAGWWKMDVLQLKAILHHIPDVGKKVSVTRIATSDALTL